LRAVQLRLSWIYKTNKWSNVTYSILRTIVADLLFPRWGEGVKIIRKTDSHFGVEAAYNIGERGVERGWENEVHLVLVTFLSSRTACHVNLFLATFRQDVSLFLFSPQYRHQVRLPDRPASARPWRVGIDGRTDGRTSDTIRQRKI